MLRRCVLPPGSLWWSSAGSEDPGHVLLAGVDLPRHDASGGGKPAAFPVSSDSEPADPVASPSTVAPFLSASAADSLALLHAVISHPALHRPQPDRRISQTRCHLRRAGSAAADAAPAGARSGPAPTSASTGLAAHALPAGNASHVAVA